MTEKIIYAYYGTWQHYSNGSKHFEVADINPKLLTHLAYAFLGVSEDGSIMHLDKWLDINLGCISKTIELKKQNPKLKILAAIGGWNVGSKPFSIMAADPFKRATFINSAKQFMLEYDFDGLDIDWEYPAQRDGQQADVENFVILLRELRNALGKNKLLTIAVAAFATSANISYNIPQIVKEVDLVNLMSYDYTGPWSNQLGFNAPLTQVETAIQYWLQKGTPACKLLMGIPLYGRIFNLANSMQTNAGDLSAGGDVGDGTLAYHEICEKLLEGDWVENWSEIDMVPYAYKRNQWISYEDGRSVKSKMNLVNNYNLGGAMVWTIEKDDFHGISGQKYPLLSTINKCK